MTGQRAQTPVNSTIKRRPSPELGFALTLAGLAGLAVGHVVEHVLHGAAVRQRARPHLAVGLLPPLALVRVEQQNQLLLDQLPLLRVGRGAGGGHGHAPSAAAAGQGQQGGLLLGLLHVREDERRRGTTELKQACHSCTTSSLV